MAKFYTVEVNKIYICTPDLTPMDFFSCGDILNQQQQSIQDQSGYLVQLKENIKQEMVDITFTNMYLKRGFSKGMRIYILKVRT